jgi:hypothetical protein
MVGTFMDDQMQLLADSQVTQPGTPDWPTLTNEQVHEWGTYVGQVFDRDGRLIASSWPALTLNKISDTGFHDTTAGGQKWRAYVARSPEGRQVQVVQSGKFRTHLAAGRALGVIAPVVVLLIVSSFILWGVVAMISRAIGDIARQAAQQDENNIAELPLTHVPREITPLIVSFNSLLARLRDAFRTLHTSCAHPSPPLACSWKHCAATCVAVKRKSASASWSRASSARSGWWTSCCACPARRR